MKTRRWFWLVSLILILNFSPIMILGQSNLENQRNEVINNMQNSAITEASLSKEEAENLLSDWETEALNGAELGNSKAYIKPEYKPSGLNLSHATEIMILDYLSNYVNLSKNNSEEENNDTISSVDKKYNDKKYPYAVNPDKLNDILIFRSDSINVPNQIELNFKTKEIVLKDLIRTNNTYKVRGHYQFELDYIPTIEKRVFSADHSGIRNVKVNSRLLLMNRETGECQSEYYLFINKEGGISLMTPNFAGNVLPEDEDVMMEYLTE